MMKREKEKTFVQRLAEEFPLGSFVIELVAVPFRMMGVFIEYIFLTTPIYLLFLLGIALLTRDTFIGDWVAAAALAAILYEIFFSKRKQ